MRFRSTSTRSTTRWLSVAMIAVVGLGVMTSPGKARRDDQEPAARAVSTNATAKQDRSDPAARAVSLAIAGEFDDARTAAAKTGDPVAITTVEWLTLRRRQSKAGYDRLMAFVSAHPKWPLVREFRKWSERLLLSARPERQRIAAHFKAYSPLSPEGWLAKAWLAKQQGKAKQVKTFVRRAWLDTSLGVSGEAFALAHFKAHIDRDMHARRLAAMIMAQKTRQAPRIASRLSQQYVRMAKVAAMLIRLRPGAAKAYRRLPVGFRNTLAMRYAYARYLRKKGAYGKAANIILALPRSHSRLIDGQAWWVEKRLNARYLLAPATRNQWPTAYKLAASHGFSSGKSFIEGEFLAGWIALRKLNKAKLALKHFRRLPAKAYSRTYRSKAWYWVARAYQALGNGDKAKAALNKAAAGSATLYYGQLALEALGKGRQPTPLNKATPSQDEFTRVAGDELIRAFQLVARSGGNVVLGQFLWPIVTRFNSAGEMAAAARVIHKAGGYAYSVRLAKLAGGRGFDIDDWSYPLGALPKWRWIGKKVERAMVYGLSRQESEFNAQAVSYAGARGLMQLLPGTARHVARRYKVRTSKARLTGEPAHNVMLGAAFLGDLADTFSGSYILTFAAYNAGPGNVRKWLKRFGDPRSGDIDPIDWVETIPFTQTRKYVQKVLQNIHVYRSRLAPRSIEPMSVDLARGSAAVKAVKASAECGARASSIAALINGC